MTRYAINELMELIMKNKDIIDNVYFFDELTDCHVQGVEIRLKNYEVRMDYLDLEDHYYRPDPFKKDVKGYVYIILGRERDYQKWLNMMIEGKVAQMLIRKYPEILRGGVKPEEREQMELDKQLFHQELVDKINL